MIVDTGRFNRVPLAFELLRQADNNIVSLVPRALTTKLVDDILTLNTPPPPSYLTGPRGLGISIILFMAAAAVLEYNREEPRNTIVLMYISNACSNACQCLSISHLMKQQSNFVEWFAQHSHSSILLILRGDLSTSPLQHWKNTFAFT